MMERMIAMLDSLGFEDMENTILEGDFAKIFTKKIGENSLTITFRKVGTNITARLDKPNRTHKWLCEKSPAQIGAILRQTISFYK